MKTTIDLDNLQQEAEKLVALLKERETGMFTWHAFLSDRMMAIQNIYSPSTPARLEAADKLVIAAKELRKHYNLDYSVQPVYVNELYAEVLAYEKARDGK